MRFRKGTSVEVLSYSEEPLGSWMCGELVSGNGLYYTVQCQSNDWKGNERILESVARHSLRPTPPLLNVKKWAHGDIVEVRCDFSWKIALVLQAIDKDNYLVKFMGYSMELEAHKRDIRPRLVWKHEKWVLIGKGHRIALSNLRECIVGDNTLNTRCKNDSLHSFIIPSSRLKRPSSSPLVGNSLKRLKIKIDGKDLRAAQLQTQQPETLHALSCFPKNRDHIRTEQSSHVDTAAYHNFPREIPNPECSLIGSHKFNDSHTVASSVGSCSISCRRGNPSSCHEIAAHSSDADSCSVGEYDKMFKLSHNETLAAEHYRIELKEYRKLLKMFHSHGFISWENEGLLTALRTSLHISDDDHLMELRQVRP